MIRLLSVVIAAGLLFGAAHQVPLTNETADTNNETHVGPIILTVGIPVNHIVHYKGCWTDWFDSDDPSGTGDWEALTNLHQQFPGKICGKPLAIEAQTLSGLSVAAAKDVIHQIGPDSGFFCRNSDQPTGKQCNDYCVRFLCQPSFCAEGGECWTDWFDSDDPSGTGDFETLADLHQQFPGKICGKPLAIEAQTLSGLSVAAAKDMIHQNDPGSGLICRNSDQPTGKQCNDYRVRFLCQPSFCAGGGAAVQPSD